MFNLFKRKKDPRELADMARQEKDVRKAVELYSDAIKLEKDSNLPDNKLLSTWFTQRGEIYLNQGVAILSSSDFLQALENNPENGIAHNNLGIWFTIKQFVTPDYVRAMEHLDKAVTYCPDRPDFKMNRAIIKIEMGQKDIGRMELEKLYQGGYSDAKLAIERFCR